MNEAGEMNEAAGVKNVAAGKKNEAAGEMNDADPLLGEEEGLLQSGGRDVMMPEFFPPLTNPITLHPVNPAPQGRENNCWSKPPVISPKPSPKFLLKFTQPIIRESRKVGVCSAAAVQGEIPALDNTLVGFFLGKRPSFSYVKSALLKQWKTAGTVDVFLLLHGGFAFRFSHSSDRDEVLDTGVFHVGGQPIFIRQWERSIHSGLLGLKHIPLWVSLPGLPLHLWSAEALSVICSTLGRPLHCDKHTAMKTRLTFARVCIEFDGKAPLEKIIEIEDDEGNTFLQPVQYDWSPPHCLYCGVFGHENRTCHMRSAAASGNEELGTMEPPKVANPESLDLSIPGGSGNPGGVQAPAELPGGSVGSIEDHLCSKQGGSDRVKKMIPDPDPNLGQIRNLDQLSASVLIGRKTASDGPASTTAAFGLSGPIPNQPSHHSRQFFSNNPDPKCCTSVSNRFKVLQQLETGEEAAVPPLLADPKAILLSPPKPSSAGHTPHPKFPPSLTRFKNGKSSSDQPAVASQSLSGLSRKQLIHAVKRSAQRVQTCVNDPPSAGQVSRFQSTVMELLPPPLAVVRPAIPEAGRKPLPECSSEANVSYDQQTSWEDPQLNETREESTGYRSDILMDDIPIQQWESAVGGPKPKV